MRRRDESQGSKVQVSKLGRQTLLIELTLMTGPSQVLVGGLSLHFWCSYVTCFWTLIWSLWAQCMCSSKVKKLYYTSTIHLASESGSTAFQKFGLNFDWTLRHWRGRGERNEESLLEKKGGKSTAALRRLQIRNNLERVRHQYGFIIFF